MASGRISLIFRRLTREKSHARSRVIFSAPPSFVPAPLSYRCPELPTAVKRTGPTMAPLGGGPGDLPIVSVDDVVDIGMSLYRVRITGPDRHTRYVLIPKGKATLTMVKVSAAALCQLMVMGVPLT
jgi:hypothetical protein